MSSEKFVNFALTKMRYANKLTHRKAHTRRFKYVDVLTGVSQKLFLRLNE